MANTIKLKKYSDVIEEYRWWNDQTRTSGKDRC